MIRSIRMLMEGDYDVMALPVGATVTGAIIDGPKVLILVSIDDNVTEKVGRGFLVIRDGTEPPAKSRLVATSDEGSVYEIVGGASR